MKKNGERGSFTIETILSLSVFMFAFVTLVSLSNIARLESTTQYAIDQTAKEISRYCYIADKANLLVHPSDGSEKKMDSIDNAVQSMYDFSDVMSDTTSKFTGTTGSDFSSKLSEIAGSVSKDDFSQMKSAAQNMYQSFGTVLEDPKGAISALAEMFASKASKAFISRIVAQPLCKILSQKYMVVNGELDTALKKMGVVDGIDGLDFSMSTFLMDERSINVVLVYKVKVKGFGFFDQEMVIKQTASTAAWLSDTTNAKIKDTTSFWQEGQFERGKDFVQQLQDENTGKAVKPGVGVDLYNQDTNTFTTVNSMNVFLSSYSDYQKISDDNLQNYKPKKSQIKAAAKKYAVKLVNDVDKIDVDIKMEDGTVCQTAKEDVKHRSKEMILVVPEETADNKEMVSTLNEIVSEIEQETGVKVKITYRQKAFGGKE